MNRVAVDAGASALNVFQLVPWGTGAALHRAVTYAPHKNSNFTMSSKKQSRDRMETKPR